MRTFEQKPETSRADAGRRQRIATVEVQSANVIARRFVLRGREVTVGRSGSCDIWIPDEHVSRVHLRLVAESAACWRVVDHGSANGTAVNGRAVDNAVLLHEDCIEIAEHVRMLFRIETAATAAALQLSARDVATYAASEAGTVELQGFVAWLRRNRRDLASSDTKELERIARECVYEFAHAEMARASDPDNRLETRRIQRDHFAPPAGDPDRHPGEASSRG